MMVHCFILIQREYHKKERKKERKKKKQKKIPQTNTIANDKTSLTSGLSLAMPL